mmetsp:Transcript_31389/g.42849  ORF Transcript_31389/g.42849 Transcript_31389/m.42849 type:complete len:119 (-) Transcript_31389:572-928(-)
MLIMTTGCVSMTTLESDGESGQRAAGGGPVRSVAASLWAWTPLAVAVPLLLFWRLTPTPLNKRKHSHSQAIQSQLQAGLALRRGHSRMPSSSPSCSARHFGPQQFVSTKTTSNSFGCS